MKIKVKKLTETAKLPTRAYNLDSGLDLFTIQDVTLQPLERQLVSTGIAIELPTIIYPDYTVEATVRPKSGLSAKGLYVALGTIDNEYTGEIKVLLINLSNELIELKQGQKIAQLVIQKVYLPEVVEVEELATRSRGNAGFGSSGSF